MVNVYDHTIPGKICRDLILLFEKNTENQFDLSALKKLKDFNKYTLKQNEDIYSIYSKNIL